MTDTNQNPDSPLFNLSIDPLVRSHLSDTARWGRFLAIMGFIGSGLILLAVIFLLANPGQFPQGFGEESGGARFAPVAFVIYMIIAIVLYFLPCLFLFRFATKMKRALATESQEELTISFQNLKVLFRYVGVLTIIVLSIYAIVILVLILGYMSAH